MSLCLAARNMKQLILYLFFLTFPRQMETKLANSLFDNSCLDIWQQKESNAKIKTGFNALDVYLDGGIALRKITEFVGKPGTGKTQICMQLSLYVQIPKAAGGLEGKALYIDTRRDFNPARLREMSVQLERRLKDAAPSFQSCSMLQNVHYISCSTVAQLLATVLGLQNYLIKQPDIKLILIDSLSFAMRMLEDVGQRTQLLLELHESLHQLLQKFNVALVITNELTHRLTSGNFSLSPALGDMHSHLVNERIWFIHSHGCYYTAEVGKVLHTNRLIGVFTINGSGITGVG